MDVTNLCPMCNGDMERIEHVLISCPFATNCWFSAGLANGVNVPDSFGSWLADCFDYMNEDHKCIAAMLCWGIWKARNDTI